MTIDSHQHFWRYDPVRNKWITEEMSRLRRDFLPMDLIPELRANGMDGCVAVQADQSEGETAFLLALASQYDEIKGVVGWANLSAPDIDKRLEHFSQFKKLRGLRHIAQSEPDDWFLVRDDFCRGVGLLKSFNLTYDILIYPKQLPAAIKLVEQFPEQKFVLDHMAKPSIRTGQVKSWAEGIEAIAASGNLYCKLSGLVTEATWDNWSNEDFTPYLDVVLEAFGPHRLMFGSDWPVCLLAADYQGVKRVISAYIRRLPPEEQRRIFGLNALYFYGLSSY